LYTCASACAALALTACGSYGTTPATVATTPAAKAVTTSTTPIAKAAPPAATAVALTADPSGQLAYVQKSLAAKAGSVTIDFTNGSPVPHDVALEAAGKPLGQTPVGSGTNKLTLTLTKGTYTFFCTVGGHRGAGMEGTLTIS